MTHNRSIKLVKRTQVVYQYREKRAVRDRRILQDKRLRAEKVIKTPSRASKTAYVKNGRTESTFDQKLYDKHLSLAGIKGHVTNLSKESTPGATLISWYHALWHIEESFRMSKSDLQGRPFRGHTEAAINAHVVKVFTALTVARHIQASTGWSLKRFIQELLPLKNTTIKFGTNQQTIPAEIPTVITSTLINAGLHPGY